MMMMNKTLQNYFRRKQIKRLYYFYHQIQPHIGAVITDPEKKKRNPMLPGIPLFSITKRQSAVFSRDAIIHFFVTVMAYFLISKILFYPLLPLIKFFHTHSSGLGTIFSFSCSAVSGFLAVEFADWLEFTTIPARDKFFDYILPITILLILIALGLYIKFYNGHLTIQKNFEEWRHGINEKLQSKPIAIKIEPLEGDNWEFVLNNQDQLTPLTGPRALEFCKGFGSNWKVYDGNPDFTFIPPFTLNRSVYVWIQDGQFFSRAGQISAGPVKPPSVWVSAQKNDKHATLCIKVVPPSTPTKEVRP